MNNELYQSLHSPIGAHAAFAVGLENKGGGFMLEDDYIPNQNIYIGYREGKTISLLPFFEPKKISEKDSYVKEEQSSEYNVETMDSQSIKRSFGYGTDSFTAPGLEFTLTSRFSEIGDLETEGDDLAEFKTLPGIIGKLVLDNSEGDRNKEALFLIDGIKRKTFLQHMTGGRISGFVSAEGYGFAVEEEDFEVREVSDFDIESLYDKKPPALLILAPMSGILINVPKGEKLEMDIAFGWYKGELSTSGGHDCRYYYTEHFSDLLQVLEYTLAHSEELWEEALENDRKAEAADLSESRKFMVAQAAKSYYVSSMLMTERESLRWIMNEGTFNMMNTFDLLIDHSFFDFKYHKWVVRNQLKYFAEEYAYYDNLGISFTHDQGVQRVFTPRGYSSYEIPNISGCFSYMTQEELCNWILATAMYVEQAEDRSFALEYSKVISDCLDSMVNRDGDVRDGIMDLDSSRCGTGAEITTYDSLDQSLGQARRNLYIAVKCMAAYIALGSLFKTLGENYGEKQALALEQAELCARTVSGFQLANGCFPAIVKEENETFIIPVIEGLIYPNYCGMKSWVQQSASVSLLITKLKEHIEKVIVPGRCLFDDGGWRLSAGSNNSWISKIFLCQHIVEEILHMDLDMKKADEAHENWWKVGCSSNPGIDQIFDGSQDERGFHYPRAVSNTLWW